MSYTQPQVQVFQDFRQLPSNVVANLNAFVFGPNYRLFRYAQASEKLLIGLGDYVADYDTQYAYPNQPAGSTVDLTYVKLYMDDVWAQYAAIAAGSANPLVVVADNARNKLRAAPRIQEAEEAIATNGIVMDAGGCYHDGPDVPETFYLYPSGGAVGGFMSRLLARASFWSAEDATLAYLTVAAGATGTVALPASATPLVPGVIMQGPCGIAFDIDKGTRRAGIVTYTGQAADTETLTVTRTGGSTVYTFKNVTAGATDIQIGATAAETYDNLKAVISRDLAGNTAFAEIVHIYGATPAAGVVYIVGKGVLAIAGTVNNAVVSDVGDFASARQPVVLTVASNGGAYFTVRVLDAALAELADRAIDDDEPIKVQYTYASGVVTAAWDATNARMTLTFESGATTLNELYTAIVTDSDLAARFDVSEISGDDTETVDVISDESTSPVPSDWDVLMLPDIYRVRVLSNPITWATANGYSHSPLFKTRGVVVGDRIRYSVAVGPTTYSGTSKVAGLEADIIAASITAPTQDSGNAATQAGDSLLPHTGLSGFVVAGADNVKAFAGTVYALADAVPWFPGRYSAGVLSDTYTVTITVSGAAGTARATITTASGSYARTNVPIVGLHWDALDAANKGMMYAGNNLWITFDKGTESDLIFEAGDTFSFTRAIEAPWTEITSARLTVGGAYTGPADTDYRLEVVRGGVFDRVVSAADGLINPSKATLTYTGRFANTDTLEIGGVIYEIDTTGGGVTPGNVQVDVSGSSTAEDDYDILTAAINAQAVAAYAMNDTTAGTLTIRGSVTIALSIVNSLTNATLAVQTARLNVSIDFANDWLAGDVDDEYVLRCTQSGTILTADFAIESQRGDNVTLIEFAGSGALNAEDLGTQGLRGYFNVSDPLLQFAAGDYWVVRVNACRPQLRVSDSAGIDQGSLITVDSATDLSIGLYGVTADFAVNTNTEGGFAPDGGLEAGDVYYISAVAAADGPIKTLILADDLPAAAVPGLEVDTTGSTPVYTANYTPSQFSSWLYLVQTGTQVTSKRTQTPPDYNWEAVAAEVTVHEGIQVQDPTWTELDGSMPWLSVYAASMFLEYRALISDYADAIYSLTDIGDVETELGTIHPDNPLAQGVYDALLNSGGVSVYFMAVPSDNLAGYLTVLEQAAKTNVVYGFAPLTRNSAILDAVEAHINALSSASEKRWRIAFASKALPVDIGKYTATTFTPPGTNWVATVKDNPSVIGTQYTLVEITNGTPALVADVHAGDIVRIKYSTDAWGDETYESYEVASVLSNTKLLLVTGPSTPVNVAAKVEIWHPYSTAEIATAVAAQASHFASRRICYIFPDVGYTGGIALTSEFMAAAVAGLTSSVPPQQGLTNIEVTGFDDLPAVYGVYTRDQLNEMAAGGALILMQDMIGDEVYVRHQVTTATPDGNLLTQELSVTKDLDAISYYFAGTLAPFIGRYNITPELLTVVETMVKDGINYLGSDRTRVGLLGPMIVLGANTKINSVEQHPTLKDHIYISVDLELPLPVNVIQLHLMV